MSYTSATAVPRTGKRNRRKVSFERTRAGRNSGMLGALSGLRRGCVCCSYYGNDERRVFKRKERAQWRDAWADEQRSELEELMAYGSWE